MTPAPKDLAQFCETNFQYGLGRAQVLDAVRPNGMRFYADIKARALSWADGREGVIVVWRAKVKGERRYEWYIVKGSLA